MNKTALLKRALGENAASVACHLWGKHNRSMSSKTELRFGRKGSRSVVTSGAKKGVYYDHEAGSGGDLLDLIQRELNIDFKEALTFAEQFVGSAGRPQFGPKCIAQRALNGAEHARQKKREALELKPLRRSAQDNR